MTHTRKRARSLDGGMSSLEDQVSDLVRIVKHRHEEIITQLSWIKNQIAVYQDEEPPCKRTKIDLSNQTLAITDGLGDINALRTQPQFGIIMRNFAASIIHSMVREASRKVTSSTSSSFQKRIALTY